MANPKEAKQIKELNPNQKKEFVKLIETGDSAREALRKVLQTEKTSGGK